MFLNICLRIETSVFHNHCYAWDLGFQADLTNGKCKHLSCFVLITEWNWNPFLFWTVCCACSLGGGGWVGSIYWGMGGKWCFRQLRILGCRSKCYGLWTPWHCLNNCHFQPLNVVKRRCTWRCECLIAGSSEWLDSWWGCWVDCLFSSLPFSRYVFTCSCSASTATTFVSHGLLIVIVIIHKFSILWQALNHWKAIVFFSSAFQDFSITWWY